MTPQDLTAAYLSTDYWVDAPTGRFAIRIGSVGGPIERILKDNNTTTWAYITACNPRSVALSDAENRLRMQQLQTDVASAGFKTFTGEGVGETGWKEASVLILGIDKHTALQLARRHEQLAFVYGTAGQPAELVWTSEG